MSIRLHLGSLRLSCPSTGLDLALTSNVSISTLSRSCSFDSPLITDIEVGRVWVAPATNVQLHVIVAWPNSISRQQIDALEKCLLTALRHAAVSLHVTHFKNIQVTSMATLLADIPLDMEPIEPSAVTYRQTLTISGRLFSSSIIDRCAVIRYGEESIHSSSEQRRPL